LKENKADDTVLMSIANLLRMTRSLKHLLFPGKLFELIWFFL